MNFEKFIRTPFLIERLRWLLLALNQVCHEYQLTDICVRVLASQRSSKQVKDQQLNDHQIVSVLFTTFSDFFGK